MASIGIPAEFSRRCLNHNEGGTHELYNLYEYRAEKLEAFKKWEAEVGRLIKQRPPVVSASPSSTYKPTVMTAQ